ncbi:jg20186 [Pararge aegeria aegeria]|nr:jg25391 [Pararge aegeria aegeria]CAH2244242.1 jg20186 [Pararge aegeria aegeria]
MRNATGCPWFVRNVDLHRDLKLPTIAQYFKKLSKIYFEKSIRHPNPLIVAASFYSPNLSATLNKRRPKHILHDPDDQITTDNAPYQNTQSTYAQRLRRRRRGPRLLTSTGRGLAPRSRKRAD